MVRKQLNPTGGSCFAVPAVSRLSSQIIKPKPATSSPSPTQATGFHCRLGWAAIHSPLPLVLIESPGNEAKGRRLQSQRAAAGRIHPLATEGATERRRRRTGGGKRARSGGGMGQALRRLFDSFFSTKEMRVVMLGLDAAGKTTILYRLHMGEVLSTVPTVGFNVEKVQYKNVAFTVWDVGGQEKLRPLWKMYLSNSDALIYVVDSLDRERIADARQEFQAIIKDPLMANSIILIFANKQDLRGAMSPAEVSEGLGLHDLRNRIWHIQGTCALRGEGLYDGLDWLASTLKKLQDTGHATSVAGPSI